MLGLKCRIHLSGIIKTKLVFIASHSPHSNVVSPFQFMIKAKESKKQELNVRGANTTNYKI